MPTTIDEIYTQVIRALPPGERLQLATLILSNLAPQNLAVVDESSTWTEEDISDLSKFSLQYAATIYPDDEELI
ncbi:MAG: hypothetical protein HC860_13440 [Alkalinema sp. RU_4_3]|nr:hypothetical protein [Alkalinema sp. RU_4_3]